MSPLLHIPVIFLLGVSRPGCVRPSEEDDVGNLHAHAPNHPVLVELSSKSMNMLHANASADHSEHSRISLSSQRADIDTRPDADNATIVKVGFVLRTFFGMKMNEGTYTADIVLTFKWKDIRVKELVTGNGKTLTLSNDAAKTKIWMPEMGVTNRDLNGIDILSTAVVLNKDTGEVTKIQRVLAVLKNKFIAKNFPFDTQVLTVLTASTKYMANEVKIEAFELGDEAASKIQPDAFEGRDVNLESFKADAFEEKSGPLDKSRGRLQVTVARKPGKFLTSIASPCSALVVMSYIVFWFPLLTPFVMPRLALSVIAFMALMQVASKYDAMIAGASLGDTYLQAFSTLMFITVVMNVAMETISHQLKASEFATQMNNEMKYLYPAMSVVCILLCTVIGIGGSATALAMSCAYGHRCYKELVNLGVIVSAAPEEALLDGEGKVGDSEDRPGSSGDKDKPAAPGGPEFQAGAQDNSK